MQNPDLSELQKDIFKKMSPEERLLNAERLYFSAREFKAAALKSFHPDWNDQQIRDAVRKSFLYAQN